MGLRLSPEGDRALEQWLSSSLRTSYRDAVVTEMLMSVVDGTWHQRWYWQPDPTDPDSRIMRADDLAVVIRPFATRDPETDFDLVRIVVLAD